MFYTWDSEAQRVLSIFFRLHTYVREETDPDPTRVNTERPSLQDAGGLHRPSCRGRPGFKRRKLLEGI